MLLIYEGILTVLLLDEYKRYSDARIGSPILVNSALKGGEHGQLFPRLRRIAPATRSYNAKLAFRHVAPEYNE